MTPLEEWQVACAGPIADLTMLADKRRRAMADLIKMQHTGVDLEKLLDEATSGQTDYQLATDPNTPYPNDPTHYLTSTQRFLDLTNQLCTEAGVLAIVPQIQTCLDGIKNLQMMDAAFVGDDHFVPVLPDDSGKPQNSDRAGAWSYLHNNVEPYLYNERVNDEAMARAGY
jgi:hypothetical protein